MTNTTENDNLQRILTRQHNQIQALVSCNHFLVECLIEIGQGGQISPADVEVLKGQLAALDTIKTSKNPRKGY